ncbi:hypothetical protein AC628_23615 [Bradyrhizobium sp. NAS96.2]|nr:hypothetical protein AC628_23615 [Bradyrhizobium sp. NAS96.2]
MTLGKQFAPEFTSVDQSAIKRNCQMAAGTRINVNRLKDSAVARFAASATNMGDCNMGPKSWILFIVLNAR